MILLKSFENFPNFLMINLDKISQKKETFVTQYLSNLTNFHSLGLFCDSNLFSSESGRAGKKSIPVSFSMESTGTVNILGLTKVS